MRGNNRENKSLKATETNTETKSEEGGDFKSFFGDFTFMVTSDPAKVQDHSASAATVMSIPEDPTTKGIFDAASAQMQVSASYAQSYVYTITIDIPKSQVAMLSKKGAALVDQGVNS